MDEEKKQDGRRRKPSEAVHLSEIKRKKSVQTGRNQAWKPGQKTKQKPGQKTKQNTGQGRKTVYMASILALTVLLGAAFLGPEWIFKLQDKSRCNDVVMGERESFDAASLETAYEQSLYQRLLRFTEDTAAGRHFYVTSQEMTVDEDFKEKFFSEWGIGQEKIYRLMERTFFPWSLWNAIYTQEAADSVSINKWTQYVIYNEDYAGGVNFIIWYVELEMEDSGIYRFLLDAESGDLYAVLSDFSRWRKWRQEVNQPFSPLENSNLLDVMGEMTGVDFSYGERMGRELAYYFGGLTFEEDELTDAAEAFGMGVEEYEQMLREYDMVMAEGGSINAKAGSIDAEAETVMQIVVDAQAGQAVNTYYDGDKADFYFPYGENTLIFRIEARGAAITMDKSGSYISIRADMAIGFPEIYQLIPEFLD